ncbi:MAG TPA: extracellular solute-binding protein [Chloroflexota bacterium]|nr:extracellular solute-binding protein [Chloroflexota bacterium]
MEPTPRRVSPLHPTTPRGAPHSRRRILGAGAGAAGAVPLGAFLAACGTGGAGSQERGATLQLTKGPLTVTAFIGGAQLDRFPDEIGKPYQQLHPNVTIEAVPQSGSTQAVIEKLTGMVAGGSPPDIFEAPRYPDFMVEKGFIDDTMDALIKRDKYKTDSYNPKEFNSRAQYQGKTVQLPWKLGGNSLVILCNTELFQKSGVPLPSTELSQAWTWDDWVQAAVKLTKRGASEVSQYGHNGLAWTIGSWPLLWQADWISSDLKQVTCDTPEMTDCYTRLQDLHYKHRVVPLPGEATQYFGNVNLFLTGRTAMQIVSVGGWSTYINATPQVPMMAAPVPKVKISTPDVNSHAMSIIRGSKSPADAWEVIKYMIDEARLPRLTERMPARLDHLEPFVKDTITATPQVSSRLVLEVARNFVPQTNLGRHPNQDAMYDVINPQLTELWNNTVAPATMLKGLRPQLEALMGRQ